MSKSKIKHRLHRARPTQREIMDSFWATAVVPHLLCGEECHVALPRAFISQMGFDPDVDPKDLPEDLRREWAHRMVTPVRLIPHLWGRLEGRPVREVLQRMDAEVADMNAAVPAMLDAKETWMINSESGNQAYANIARTYLYHLHMFLVFRAIIVKAFLDKNFELLSRYASPELLRSVSVSAIKRNAMVLMPNDFDARKFHHYAQAVKAMDRRWKSDMGHDEYRAKANSPELPPRNGANTKDVSELPRLIKLEPREQRMASHVPREKQPLPADTSGHSIERSAAAFRVFDSLSNGLDELDSSEPESARALRELLSANEISREAALRLIIGGPLARRIFLTAAGNPAFVNEFGDQGKEVAARGIGWIGGYGRKLAKAHDAFQDATGKRHNDVFEWLVAKGLIGLHGHDRTVYLTREI